MTRQEILNLRNSMMIQDESPVIREAGYFWGVTANGNYAMTFRGERVAAVANHHDMREWDLLTDIYRSMVDADIDDVELSA